MPIQEIPYGGWSRNLRLANDSVELILSLEIGPRILSYRPLNGTNILHNFPEHMGGADESEWVCRGGHRFWISPEDPVLSYLPDNLPFPYQQTDAHTVILTNPSAPARQIRKDLTVTLATTGSGVQLTHTLTNEDTYPHSVAPWALTVMPPGGLSILAQPPFGEHPRDLLPDRALILWPYSDTSDSRFQLGRNFITLRQETGRPSFKFGLAHRGKWAAYLLDDQLFIKTVAHLADATYPDFGCNYESFTNSDMLEIETLGPLVDLAPGQSTSHIEHWRVFANTNPPPYTDTSDFADWLQPYLP